jgi:hypothetical protein
VAKERKSFRKGLILGAAVGAAAMFWNAPHPGWQTRETLLEWYERLLFRVIDLPRALTGTDEPQPSTVAQEMR